MLNYNARSFTGIKDAQVVLSPFSETYYQLNRALLGTAIDAFNLKHRGLNAALGLTLLPLNLRVAYYGYQYERRVAKHSHVKIASEWLLSFYARDWSASWTEAAPTQGPLLVVCNHAGMGDAIAVHATLPRTDIKTVVLLRGILNGLPHFTEHCVIIDENKPSTALKQMIRHLQQGNSLLLFPRGEIEADPALNLDAALGSLGDWSKSVDLLARKIPNLTVLPVAVGGLISRHALGNPLVRLQNHPNQKNFLAATLQMLCHPIYKDVHVHVVYGSPLSGENATLENVQVEMKWALEEIYTQQHTLVTEGVLRPSPR